MDLSLLSSMTIGQLENIQEIIQSIITQKKWNKICEMNLQICKYENDHPELEIFKSFRYLDNKDYEIKIVYNYEGVNHSFYSTHHDKNTALLQAYRQIIQFFDIIKKTESKHNYEKHLQLPLEDRINLPLFNKRDDNDEDNVYDDSIDNTTLLCSYATSHQSTLLKSGFTKESLDKELDDYMRSSKTTNQENTYTHLPQKLTYEQHLQLPLKMRLNMPLFNGRENCEEDDGNGDSVHDRTITKQTLDKELDEELSPNILRLPLSYQQHLELPLSVRSNMALFNGREDCQDDDGNGDSLHDSSVTKELLDKELEDYMSSTASEINNEWQEYIKKEYLFM